jgi:hypothetical protein
MQKKVKHACEAPGAEQKIEICQVGQASPWFMLVDDSVIRVNSCPWCGLHLPVKQQQCSNDAHSFIICPVCIARIPLIEFGAHIESEIKRAVEEAHQRTER